MRADALWRLQDAQTRRALAELFLNQDAGPQALRELATALEAEAAAVRDLAETFPSDKTPPYPPPAPASPPPRTRRS